MDTIKRLKIMVSILLIICSSLVTLHIFDKEQIHLLKDKLVIIHKHDSVSTDFVEKGEVIVEKMKAGEKEIEKLKNKR